MYLSTITKTHKHDVQIQNCNRLKFGFRREKRPGTAYDVDVVSLRLFENRDVRSSAISQIMNSKIKKLNSNR